MYSSMNKMRKFLKASRATKPGKETADGAPSPAISPGGEAGASDFAGNKNPFSESPQESPGAGPVEADSLGGGTRQGLAHALANHHQKLADHFRAAAGGAASSPSDEAESPAEAASETPEDEFLEGESGTSHGHGAIEGSPEEEAGETAAFEAKEDLDKKRKKGGGLRNSNASEKPLSRFTPFAKGR
jgi:hypothetical protein